MSIFMLIRGDVSDSLGHLMVLDGSLCSKFCLLACQQ